jgi:hypothetical protein
MSIPPGPKPADPTRSSFAEIVPRGRVVRPDVFAILEDSYAVLRRELARFRASKALSPGEIRSLVDLTRAAKEVRQLEQLSEEELEESLAKQSDDDVRGRAK